MEIWIAVLVALTAVLALFAVPTTGDWMTSSPPSWRLRTTTGQRVPQVRSNCR